MLDKIAGGWTVSTIVTFQSGTPFRIAGNNNTFNNLRDGGLVLNGITAAGHSGQRRPLLRPGRAAVLPAAGLGRPGQGRWNHYGQQRAGHVGDIFYLHGPHQTYVDMGLSKSVPITGSVRFKFQMEMLNALNHPVFHRAPRA